MVLRRLIVSWVLLNISGVLFDVLSNISEVFFDMSIFWSVKMLWPEDEEKTDDFGYR